MWLRESRECPRALLTALLVLASLVLGLSGQARAADPTIATVGDMACPPTDPSYNAGNGTATNCRQKYVSDLIAPSLPSALLDLGDNQYTNGELANYQAVYHPTFGRANTVVFPTIGNAEYNTAGAQGFFDYFSSVGVASRIAGTPGADTSNYASGYYSFDIGTWHAVALNSNCAEIGGCGTGSPQEVWLKNDLATHSNFCTLAYWHHPRWNSGTLGNDASTSAFWTDLYNANADLVLNGHGNHHYERFVPQTPGGVPDTSKGVREFIVSTGGESHGTPPSPPGDPNTSEITDYTSYGVLRLTLHPSGYDWQFVPAVGGSFTDSGTGNCHAAAAQAPSAPTLSALAGNNSVHLSWTAPADGGAPITNYKIYRGTAAGGETLLKTVGNVTSDDDNTAVNGTKYYYRVSAVNSVSEGPQSNEVSATPSAAPPPTFPRTPVLDDFARPAGSLGVNWQSPALQDAGTVTIKSSGQTGSSAGAASATWNGTFGPDEEAYLTVPTLPTAGDFMQVATRLSTQSSSNPSCYFLRVTPSTSTWDIREKLNGNTSTSIQTFTAPFAAGDGMGLQVIGSTLTAYRKAGAAAWTSVGSTTDPTITAGGFISFTLGDTTNRGGAFGGGTVTAATTPSAPTLATPTAGDGVVHLSWTAPFNGGAPITAYNVYRGTTAGGETVLKTVGNVTSTDDTSPVNGTKYYYRVAAVNSVGEGSQSNEVSSTPLSAISVNDVARAEGNTGQTDFTFTVSLSAASSAPVTVDYATQDGTATSASSDYVAATGTVTIPAGQASKTVTVKVNGDTTFEPDEGFSLKLTNPGGATIADDTGAGTIQNDDTQPTLTVNDVSRAEGDSGQTAYVFTVSLSNPSYQTITVSRQTQDGTATTADSDYAGLSAATLTFAPGETQKQVTVNVNGDNKFEPDEGFSLKLSGATNATIADDTGAGTIQNDDAQPTLAVNDVSRAEGDTGQTDFTFTVSLTNPSYQTITVDYATQDGTATTAGGDYAQTNGTVSFAAGETSKTVTVKVNGDTTFEPDEGFALKLSNPTNATITDDTGAGTIQNDDPQPRIAVNDVSHAEGDTGQTDFTFTVSLTNPSAQAITVDYATQDGTATTAGGDYAQVNGTLSFAAGEATKTVTVKANGDTTFEPDETFALKLSNPTNATIADDTGAGTIQNDDSQPQISINDVSHPEGDTGQTDFAFTVSLSAASSSSVTVDYATQDGAATTADSDYAQANGTLTFDPGQTSKTVTVKVNGDTAVEADQDFSVKLSNATGAPIADDTGIGTIQNDDRSYARPKGATPMYTALVPTFQECTTPNDTHGGPLAQGGSCTPPAQATPNLTVGTPDANGANANFTGSVRLSVCTDASCGGSDVSVKVTLADVRCQGSEAACDVIPNAAGGPDYTGELGLDVSMRVTDRGNLDPSGGGPEPGTVQDMTLPATIPCSGTIDLSIGGHCDLQTTVNTLVPGTVIQGKRAIWQLGQVKVDDAGPDGLVSTPDGVAPFAVQGVFVP